MVTMLTNTTMTSRRCSNQRLVRTLKLASEMQNLAEDPDNNLEVVQVTDPVKAMQDQKSEAVRARILSKYMLRILFPV